MKKFLIKTSGYLLLLILTIELFYGQSPSVFSLRSFIGFSKDKVMGAAMDTVPRNPDGEPIQLRKNNIGYYAHSDFFPEKLQGNYALIGDSFVNSTVCGTYNSIAYLLDEALENATVYNFGDAGGSIHDYYNMYDEYNLKELKTVFIVLTGTNDISYRESKMNFKPTPSVFVNLLQTKIDGPKLYESPNYNLIRKDSKNIVYILHDNLSAAALRANGVTQDLIEITIDKSLRFSDGHYKREGNLLIANKIKEYLKENP